MWHLSDSSQNYYKGQQQDKNQELETKTHHPHAVMRMFSHLRAVEDLEPLPLPEAEVILGPRLVVIESHK